MNNLHKFWKFKKIVGNGFIRPDYETGGAEPRPYGSVLLLRATARVAPAESGAERRGVRDKKSRGGQDVRPCGVIHSGTMWASSPTE